MTATATIPANRRRVTQHGEFLELVNLTRVGAAGWQWTIRRSVLGTDVAEETTRRTDGAGRGLWEGDRQISGTSQFSLPAERAVAVRELLRSRR